MFKNRRRLAGWALMALRRSRHTPLAVFAGPASSVGARRRRPVAHGIFRSAGRVRSVLADLQGLAADARPEGLAANRRRRPASPRGGPSSGRRLLFRIRVGTDADAGVGQAAEGAPARNRSLVAGLLAGLRARRGGRPADGAWRAVPARRRRGRRLGVDRFRGCGRCSARGGWPVNAGGGAGRNVRRRRRARRNRYER